MEDLVIKDGEWLMVFKPVKAPATYFELKSKDIATDIPVDALENPEEIKKVSACYIDENILESYASKVIELKNKIKAANMETVGRIYWKEVAAATAGSAVVLYAIEPSSVPYAFLVGPVAALGYRGYRKLSRWLKHRKLEKELGKTLLDLMTASIYCQVMSVTNSEAHTESN